MLITIGPLAMGEGFGARCPPTNDSLPEPSSLDNRLKSVRDHRTGALHKHMLVDPRGGIGIDPSGIHHLAALKHRKAIREPNGVGLLSRPISTLWR
jgi:hypothetical protein